MGRAQSADEKDIRFILKQEKAEDLAGVKVLCYDFQSGHLSSHFNGV